MRYQAIALSCALGLGSIPTALAGSLSGPVIDADVQAELVDVVQFPATDLSPPLTRLEFLRELPDDSGRLAVNDMRGPLYFLSGTTITTYLDVAAQIPRLDTSGLQMGFVSFAFHPDFARNGIFYTAQTESIGVELPTLEPPLAIPVRHHAVVVEWTADDPAAPVFSGTNRELLRIASPHPFHNLGEIGFDPTIGPGHVDYGLLYIACGDFGSVVRGDSGQLQRLDTVYGSILRIDPLGGPFERDGIIYPYGIPANNPFAGDADPATLGEIFANGFRNPQNFHFDRAGGAVYVSDIGESNLEEVNRLVAGGNYGWPVREGTYAIDVTVSRTSVFPLPADDASLGYRYPLLQYDHQEGRAIAGGFAVRAARASDLEDSFVCGDIVNGRMFYASLDEMLAVEDAQPVATASLYELTLLRGGSPMTLLDVIGDALESPNQFRTDVRFHADRRGRLYITTKRDGFLRELIPLPAGVTRADVQPPRKPGVLVVPNPFNPRAEFRFSLERRTRATIEVFDSRGRRLRSLDTGPLDAGDHAVSWDARDDHGAALATGSYLFRVRAGAWEASGRFALVR